MKQHFLSQCYLNEFANSNKQFYALNMKQLKEGRTPIPRLKRAVEVCYEKDFYTLKFNLFDKYRAWGQEHPYALESSFHWYEKEYPAVIRKITSRKTLTINDAYLLAYALFDFKVRNKYHRNNSIERSRKSLTENASQGVIGELDDEILDRFNIGRERALEVVKIVNKRLSEAPEFAKEMHLHTMLDRKSDANSIQNKVAISLLHSQWNVFIAPPNQQFITSDNPGFCFDKEERVHNTRFDTGYYCVLVLSPKQCLLITDEQPDMNIIENSSSKLVSYKTSSPDFVKLINKASTSFINQYLFANCEQVLDQYAKLPTDYI